MLVLLTRLNKNLILAIPAAMLLGFAYGSIAPAAWLQQLIVPLTFLMVYPMMVNLKFAKLVEGGNGKALGLAQLINFAIIPFVAWGLGKLFFADQPAYALGLLIAALLPTSGMTISWTGFAKGNLAAAVKMTILGLILGSLATPFYVRWLMGAELDVDLVAIFRQIAIIVFLPMIAGHFTQQWLIKRHGAATYQQKFAPRFPPFSTLGVLGIVFVALALKAEDLLAQPGEIGIVLLPLLCLYLINYLLSTFIARRMLPRGEAIALVYGTVMRNLSIALALAMNVFSGSGSGAALVIALAYILQVQSAAWYVKLTDRFFGAAPGAER